MTPNTTDWPVDRPLDAGQVTSMVLESLRLQADKEDVYFLAQHLVDPERLAIDLNIADRETFMRVNYGSFPAIANSFVARLVRIGILEPWFPDNRPMVHVVVPPGRRSALESLEAVNRHATVTLVEVLEDVPLRESSVRSISSGAEAHTVVRDAVTMVEARLRDKLGIAGDRARGRQDLIGLAFNLRNGRLRYSEEGAVQEGIMKLFQGFFAVIGTEPHHAMPTYGSSEVAKILVMSDYLLGVIAESKVTSESEAPGA